MCGHSAQESADSIKIVANLLSVALPNLQHSSATSNSGGGGAIQNVHPKLIEMKVMLRDSRRNHCDLHGLNKPLEEGLKRALGDAGIGHNTPWQLLFVVDLFMDHLVEIYSKNNLDRMWSDINAVMMDSAPFQDEWMGHGGLLFSDFYNAIQDQANIDPESVSHQLNSAPGNRKDPVFTRWLTVLMANEVFIRHYFTLYFLAIRIKQLNKSGSLAHTYTCQLLALTRIKPAGAKLGELRRLSWC